MKYKIISAHPGVDEFRYYKSRSDAECDKNLIRSEMRIGSKGANCALALAKKGAQVDYFTVGNGAYACDSFFSDTNVNVIRTATCAKERKNVKLIYPELTAGGECINGMTELNGRMQALTVEEKNAFFSSITEDREKDKSDLSTYVFTGSLPTNVESSEYLRCISHFLSLGEYVVLDGRGSLISAQNENFASLIKPNRDEFDEIACNVDILKDFQRPVDKSPEFFNEYLRYALKYVEKYGSDVLLTLGEAGLVYASADEHYIKKATPVKLLYPAGMGDRLLSLFLYYKRSEGASTNEALDIAMTEVCE